MVGNVKFNVMDKVQSIPDRDFGVIAKIDRLDGMALVTWEHGDATWSAFNNLRFVARSKTYTIATTVPDSDGSFLLLATVPDGGDIDASVRDEIRKSRLGVPGTVAYQVTSGLILTDERPDDDTRIVWEGHDCGWLIDETGRTFIYAVAA